MNRAIHRHMTIASTALLLALVPALAHAQVNTLPPELYGIGIDEHLGGAVPLDGEFRDHEGNLVHLSQFVDGRRPVVLDLGYYRCPMLCNLVMNALVNGLRQTNWTVGDQFDVITLSIDPREGPAEATQKREGILQAYRRSEAEHGWHFLTGSEREIRRVADAVGFRYRYDDRQGQFAHPAAVMLLTPTGHVARYLYGIEFNPNDLRIGLLEASQGHSISTVERILLFCYHYDPHGRKYVIVAMRVMQVGGAATALALIGFLSVFWLRERTRSMTPVKSPTPGPNPPPTPLDTTAAKAPDR